MSSYKLASFNYKQCTIILWVCRLFISTLRLFKCSLSSFQSFVTILTSDVPPLRKNNTFWWDVTEDLKQYPFLWNIEQKTLTHKEPHKIGIMLGEEVIQVIDTGKGALIGFLSFHCYSGSVWHPKLERKKNTSLVDSWYTTNRLASDHIWQAQQNLQVGLCVA